MKPECPLCRRIDELLLWQSPQCRVIAAPQPAYSAFCRVIWNDHVAEMSDLTPAQRTQLMAVVWAMEEALRELLQPAKINVASLGNQVPHLHWHVIPRFADDAHFPDAVWAPARRTGADHAVDRAALAEALRRRLA